MPKEISQLTGSAIQAKNIFLVLDYDGTLAEFAPTPDTIIPDPRIISLMQNLIAAPGITPAILSGRRLAHIQKLVPLQGMLLAGTYGIEMQLPDGQLLMRLSFSEIRPTIEKILIEWQALLEKREGFYLEDKGWSLAIHGRFANPDELPIIMNKAKHIVQNLHLSNEYRLSGDAMFLELAPATANKANAVDMILNKIVPDDALIIYAGDDAKDEEAFKVIIAKHGNAIKVCAVEVETLAQYRLARPHELLEWLRNLINNRK